MSEVISFPQHRETACKRLANEVSPVKRAMRPDKGTRWRGDSSLSVGR